MPEENSRAAALIWGRILPKVIRDRFGQKANAQRAHGPLFCGRRDANMRPAKMSRAEIYLPALANRQRLLLRVDTEGRNRLASARVRSPRLSRVFACR